SSATRMATMSVNVFLRPRRIALMALTAGSSGLLSAQTFRGPRSGPAPALNATPPGGLNVGTFPGITEAQMFFYQQALNLDFQMVELAVTNARSELARVSLSIPRDDAAIAAAAARLADADRTAALKK